MNPHENSDILPSIVEQHGYSVSHYLVHEIFWTVDGDEQAMRDFELLGEFHDKASAWACYNKNKIGMRDIRLGETRQYLDGHREYVRIGGNPLL